MILDSRYWILDLDPRLKILKYILEELLSYNYFQYRESSIEHQVSGLSNDNHFLITGQISLADSFFYIIFYGFTDLWKIYLI